MTQFILTGAILFACADSWTNCNDYPDYCPGEPLADDVNAGLVQENCRQTCNQCPETAAGPPGPSIGGCRPGQSRSVLCEACGTSETITCQPDGEWPPDPPCTCCTDPGEISNAVRIETKPFKIGDTVTYICDFGYTVMGSVIHFAQIRCQPNGKWETLPTCSSTRVTGRCPDPGQVPFATRSGATDFTVGAIVRYICDDCYTGGQAVICQDNGEWSAMPVCRRSSSMTCFDPGTPVNGQRIAPDFNCGSTVTFTCNSGYNLDGASSITCQKSGTWSDRLPTCRRVPCPCGNPPTLQNGVLSPLSGPYNCGSSVDYRCNSGYTIQGNSRLICETDGWSGGTPLCEREPCECENPPTLPNGIFNPPFGPYHCGVILDYRCNSGFIIQGNRTIICNTVGQWSGGAPVCQSSTCPDPGQIPFARRTGATDFRVGAIIRYTCDECYTGGQAIICQANGDWSEMPVCRPVTCPDPGRPSNGERIRTDFNCGSRVTFTCNSGYNLDGVSTITCLSSGTWSDETPTCTREEICTCNNPQLLENGVMNPPFGPYNCRDFVDYKCNSGYTMQGNSRITCDPNTRRWSGGAPVCKRDICTCNNPPALQDGVVSPPFGSYNCGSAVDYRCNSGFTLLGNSRITCNTNTRQWSGSVPFCQQQQCTCSNLPTLQNDVITPAFGPYNCGSVVDYRCNSGYTIQGNNRITCDTNTRRWSGGAPFCEREVCTCNNPPVLQNGAVSPAFGPYNCGSVVDYQCNSGFTIQGNGRIICDTNTRRWNGGAPLCEREECTCNNPPTLQNGAVSPPFGPFNCGSAVDYRCDSGFIIQGNSRITCNTNTRQWSGGAPFCRHDICQCDNPPAIQNGVLSPTFGPYRCGAVVTYQCNFGFTQRGNYRITCDRNTRQWSGGAPVCQQVGCGDPGEVSRAQRVSVTSFSTGGVATYRCNPGYSVYNQGSVSTTVTRTCQADGQWTRAPVCVLLFYVGSIG